MVDWRLILHPQGSSWCLPFPPLLSFCFCCLCALWRFAAVGFRGRAGGREAAIESARACYVYVACSVLRGRGRKKTEAGSSLLASSGLCKDWEMVQLFWPVEQMGYLRHIERYLRSISTSSAVCCSSPRRRDSAAKNRRSYSQRLDKALDEIVHKTFSAIGFHVSGVALS